MTFHSNIKYHLNYPKGFIFQCIAIVRVVIFTCGLRLFQKHLTRQGLASVPHTVRVCELQCFIWLVYQTWIKRSAPRPHVWNLPILCTGTEKNQQDLVLVGLKFQLPCKKCQLYFLTDFSVRRTEFDVLHLSSKSVENCLTEGRSSRFH